MRRVSPADGKRVTSPDLLEHVKVMREQIGWHTETGTKFFRGPVADRKIIHDCQPRHVTQRCVHLRPVRYVVHTLSQSLLSESDVAGR